MALRILSALAFAALALCLAMTGAAVDRVGEVQAQEPTEEFADLGVTITVPDSSFARREVEIAVSNHGNRAVYDVEVVLSVLVVGTGQLPIDLLSIDTGTFTRSSNPSVDDPNVWRIERIDAQSSHLGSFQSFDVSRDPDDNNMIRRTSLLEWKASVTSAYPESESRVYNNKAEAWQGVADHVSFPTEARYSLMSSVDDSPPLTDGTGAANFVITVVRPETHVLVGRATFGGYVSVELTPGLSAGAPTFEVIDSVGDPVSPTPSNVSYDHNDNDNTGRFKIGYSDTHTSFTMTLPVTVDNGATLYEQCLMAEVIATPPAGPFPPYDDPSDNLAKVCLGSPPPTTPLQSGAVSAFTFYPCVGITTDPCDSNDDVRVRATVPDQDGYILDSDTAVFHVQDHPLARAFDSHAGSVNSGTDVSWQTSCYEGSGSCTELKADSHDPDREEFGVKIGWNRIPFNGHWRRDGAGSWEGISVNVTARGKDAGPDPPGAMHFRWAGSRNAFHMTNTSNGWSHTWTRAYPWLPTGDATSISRVVAEFETLGTYIVDYTLRAKHFSETGDCDTEIDTDNNPDSFCGTETYIFHVGPMADLSVADGGPSPDVAADQYAITIAALNNGPDHALDAEVAINLALPAGVIVADHIASTVLPTPTANGTCARCGRKTTSGTTGDPWASPRKPR